MVIATRATDAPEPRAEREAQNEVILREPTFVHFARARTTLCARASDAQ